MACKVLPHAMRRCEPLHRPVWGGVVRTPCGLVRLVAQVRIRVCPFSIEEANPLKVENVAVIGAGLAGLTVAYELAAQGVSVQVFDKSRGVGGRMATRRRFPNDFDHGAQYFTARDPGFRARVAEWEAQGVVRPWDGTIVSLGSGSNREASATTRFVGTPRMTAAPKALAANLDVRLSARVVALDRDPQQKWSVTTEEGLREEGFSHVVLATPAPQAAPLLSAAPALQTAAANISMLPCHAAMIRFERPVEVAFDAAFVANPSLAWAARNRSKPGRPDGEAWVLHSTPAFSRAELDTPPEELAAPLLEAFSSHVDGRLPPVRSSDVHRWLFARAERFVEQPYLFDDDTGLALCGDWLLGDRVECAHQSGAELARFLLSL